ncbi:MAG: D-2-hydroxyacid dehydrogenase [Thermomicrobiales bacterium]|nr:D-2-hydroxyacid dehydrogenase [Thermomicrobiales bacterium]
MTDNSANRVVVLICTPLEAEFVERIASFDPDRVEVRYRADLVPTPHFVADHHGEPGWKRTPEGEAEWRAMAADAEILWDVPEGNDVPVLEQCPNVRWIQTTSAGVGPMIREKGLADTDIIVTTSSGIHATPLAEFVFAALLYNIKIIPQLLAWQQQKSWERYCAGELRGQTLTLVGPGRIGSEVARLAKALGMRVVAVGATPPGQRQPNPDFDVYVDYSGIDEALGQGDCVVLACPLTAQTDGLVGRRQIDAMKPGVALVNIARGAVIDEEAMIEALQTGHIGFAALDVFQVEPLPETSPLWSMPNVLVNPHSASTAWAENERITDIFVANLAHYLKGQYDQMSPILDKQRGY